ncbi:hypothetical protein [Virgibacillus halodenitrificans]|nr:hypothetical protein [Virgibacillus halodenitrificans]
MAIFIDEFHEGVKRKEYIFGRGLETLGGSLVVFVRIKNRKL